MGFRITYTQLAIVVTVTVTSGCAKHAAVLHVEIVAVTKHMATALNGDSSSNITLLIMVQGLPLLGGKAPDVAVILGNSADAVGDQHRRAAEAISRTVQFTALGQEHSVIISTNHIHDLLGGDVHLHRLTMIGCGAVTQLSIAVAAPCPDRTVLFQGEITAFISSHFLHAGHRLAVVEVIASSYVFIIYPSVFLP